MSLPADAALAPYLPLDAGVAVVRDGADTLVLASAREVVAAWGEDAFRKIERCAAGGFWVGFLAYDLGRTVERVVPRADDDLGLPDLLFARYDARLVLRADAEPRLEGTGPGRRLLEQVRWRARRDLAATRPGVEGPWRSSLSRRGHADGVAAVLELLRAGECYQVNLTRRLTARIVHGGPDPRAMYAALAVANPAPSAALCTFGADGPPITVVSASPELFLRVDGTHVVTRPIKGTAREAGFLARSAKDRAENVMIVDLARNDLGRVCVPGTVRVPELSAIEAHPGLFHLVSTVEGCLDSGAGLADLVRATFPPASVTGAPKPRVLQAIEDLEPVRRGVYCGAVGWIDGDRNAAQLSVAIRTFTLTPGCAQLGVGGGIVADSQPAAEWEETELKVAQLLAAVRSERHVGAGRVRAPVGHA